MRASFAFALALLALLIGATIATARTWEVTPSGRNTATGRLVFSASEASVTCAVTLLGSLASRAEGTVGAREPATNPRIGSFTSGSTGECSGGEVRLSFPERSWQLYIERFEGTTPYVYIQNAQVLVTAGGGIVRCQYEAAITTRYAEKTGQMTVTGLAVLRQTALLGAICPPGPGLSGVLNDTSEGGRCPRMGPRLSANPGAMEYGHTLRTLTLELRNDTEQRLQISRLIWTNSGELKWRVVRLTCGTLEARTGTCFIEIESTLLSADAVLEIRDGDEHTLVEIEFKP